MAFPLILAGIILGAGVITTSSMANMTTLNLLLDGSDYSTSESSQFNVNGEQEGEVYNPTKYGDPNELLQSGLSANGTGGLNLLWLLQNAKDPDKSSYAYQILEGYANLENGKYNSFDKHLTASALAGSHSNETGLTTFVEPDSKKFGKKGSGILGKTINGKVITLENAVKADIIGNAPKTGSVWADKDSSGGDGCPDGPFQVIQCQPTKSERLGEIANKARGDGKYDLYSFPDAMNVKDYKYNELLKSFDGTGYTPSGQVLDMLNALAHNRGDSGVGWLTFGLPYNLSSPPSKYVKSATLSGMEPEDLKIAASFPENMIKWFNAANLPLELVTKYSGETSQAFTMLLTIKNGGFVQKDVFGHTKSGMEKLDNSVIETLFPGQTNKTIVSYINSKHKKNPWDVLGMSKSEYDKVYGTSGLSTYESVYGDDYSRNNVFYIDKSVKSSNYTAGENVVVHSYDGIALGYMFDIGFLGEYIILELALEAGIKSLTNGTVIDPTNPQTAYQKMAPAESGNFNPADSAGGNFGTYMDYLGLTGTMTAPQQEQIKVLYEHSGGKYSQPKRGTYDEKTGTYFMDCSAFASIGINMKSGKGVTLYDTGSIANGAWLKSHGKTKKVDGVEYEIQAYQLNKSGSVIKGKTSSDKSQAQSFTAWKDKLITGDIIVTKGRGHVSMYGGYNASDKKIVIPPDISRVQSKYSFVKAKSHFQFESINPDRATGLRDYLPRNPSSNPNEPHLVFRPVFNVR